MTATFDTTAYWLERGKSYIGESARLSKQFYRDQEQFFCDTGADFKPKSILEVGCGFGRLTKRLNAAFPEALIAAIDLSDHQLVNAKAYCEDSPNLTFYRGDICDFATPFARDQTFDIALGCEVFLHLPYVVQAITNLLSAAKVVIHDYDPATKPGDRTGPHCFAHDYERIYSDLGLSFVRKIRGEHGLMVVRR